MCVYVCVCPCPLLSFSHSFDLYLSFVSLFQTLTVTTVAGSLLGNSGFPDGIGTAAFFSLTNDLLVLFLSLPFSLSLSPSLSLLISFFLSLSLSLYTSLAFQVLPRSGDILVA